MEKILDMQGGRSPFSVFLRSMSQTITTPVSAEHVTKDGRVITCEWYATLPVNSPRREHRRSVSGAGRHRTTPDTGAPRKAKEIAEAASKAKSEFHSMMPRDSHTNEWHYRPQQPASGKPDPGRAAPIRPRDSLLSRQPAFGNYDILDFSKVDAGKMDLEQFPFDLQVAIEDVLDLAAVNAQEKS